MLDAQVARYVKYIEQHEGITPSALATHFNVSERTVRTYIAKANQSLGLTAHIKKQRGDGYTLEVNNEAAFRALISDEEAPQGLLPTTNDERVSYLLNDLLSRTNWITIDDLADILFVSHNTVGRTLKQVEEILDRFGLTLERRAHWGVRVSGSEMSRRLCLASLSLEGIIDKGVIDKHTLETIAECVKSVLDKEQFQINSAAYQNLLVHLAVTIERVRKDCYIPMEHDYLGRLQKTNEYEVAASVSEAISQAFDITLPEEEVGYIAIHLASKQSLFMPGEDNDSGLVISEEVWDTVALMLENVWQAFHFDFRNDIELRMNLACHVVPLSLRLRYHMRIDNPLLDDIVTRFPLAYSMALDSSSVLAEKYGSRLSEEEVGYLALAFELAIERQRTELPRKNILLVCASGQGSAKLLEWRYRREFGTYLGNVITCDVTRIDEVDFTDIDYVFTTVPLARRLPVPVCEVQYFLEERDVRTVRNILEGRDDDSQSLISYFDEQLFLPHLVAKNKQEIIEAMCRVVRVRRGVSERFQKLVERRERLAQTCFGNLVAMPHPAEAVTSETFVAVAILDEPVKWNDQPVQVVFLVSVSKSKNKDLDRFYRGLVQVFTSSDAIKRLVKHQEWEVLVSILEETEKFL